MAKSRKRRKKFPLFWVLYLLFIFAMILFWLGVVKRVTVSLMEYEASQPERKIEAIVAEIKEGKLEEYFVVSANGTEYEAKEVYRDAYRARVNGKEITYAKDATSPLEAPVYKLYADDDMFGTITLKETSKQPLMFILSLSTWAIEKTKSIYETGTENVEITIPDIYEAYINDNLVGEKEVISSGKEMPQFRYLKEYVDVPKLVTYRVEGLAEVPKIKITDNQGGLVEFDDEYVDGTTKIYSDAFNSIEISEELEKMVLENEKLYSNFLTRDVEKSRIESLFPKGSLYLDYRDGWTISKHNTPIFTDESVTNYVEYSEDFFSCDVYMMKSMFIPRTGKTIEQALHERVYYGRINGSWKILEMNSLSHEEIELE